MMENAVENVRNIIDAVKTKEKERKSLGRAPNK